MKINKPNMMVRQDKLSLLILFIAVLLTLFVPYDLDGENYLYWFFSRILLETGEFIVTERSPLYTVYLLLFTWLEYPISVVLEYLVTALITMTIFYIFFRHFVSSSISLLISIIWMPYLLFNTTPQVQMLALSCSLIAMMFRINGERRKNIVMFYSFMLLSYLFRPTYEFMILLFLIHDIWYFFIKGKILISKPYVFKPKLIDIPMFSVITLMIIFHMFQSNHLFNNAGGNDRTWYPYTTKSLTNNNLLSSWNWKYVENKYGSNEGRDFYFTHKEVFGDADSPLDAFIANPIVVYNHIISNTKTFVIEVGFTLSNHLSIIMTVMIPILLVFRDLLINPRSLSRLISYFLVGYIIFVILTGIIFDFESRSYFIKAFALAVILYGSFRLCDRNTILELFTLSSFVLILLTIISIPKNRYLIPFAPIVITSAIWYGGQAKMFFNKYIIKPGNLSIFIGGIGLFLVVLQLTSNLLIEDSTQQSRAIILFGIIFILVSSSILILTGFFAQKDYLDKFFSRLRIVIIPIFLVLFSSIYPVWTNVIISTLNNLSSPDNKLISYNDPERVSYEEINSLVQDCNGIMTYETLFFGAFMNVGLNKLYNIGEIPPFGKFGNSEYEGLNIERIDCLFISNIYAGPPGWYSNEKIRYKNFIEPYSTELISLGAEQHELPFYGKAIILRHE
jgi:hypothetical protein